jgi:hypothetical protein
MMGTFGHGDVLIWMFEIFMFVVWFWLLMTVVGDLFRDHEVSGAAKALWIIGLLLFPYVGVLAYLIVRGGGMGERAARQVRAAQEQIDAHIRSVAGAAASPADQIQKAKALLDAGAINRAEFDRLKAKALQ